MEISSNELISIAEYISSIKSEDIEDLYDIQREIINRLINIEFALSKKDDLDLDE